MTFCWIRNLVSRNDSRTGTCDIMRDGVAVPPAVWPPVGAPGDVGAWAGESGVRAPSAPGRALSIRLSSDMGSTP